MKQWSSMVAAPVLAVFVVVMLFPAESAWAQEPPQQQEAAQETSQETAGEENPQHPRLRINEVTVTGSKEAESKRNTPSSVTILEKEELEAVKPSHPSDIMNRVPGVYVNITGGEGHMTSIRQPISTKPLYLYLEDGIPTRSTGFFNHNAMYEINLPQSEGIEITKGPGSALYGSEAIGGIVNVLTQPPPKEELWKLGLEGGYWGWHRELLSYGTPNEAGGVVGGVNNTHTDGWRDKTAYDRQSLFLRWDYTTEGGTVFKTILNTSLIDQQTAGTSQISKADYLTNPTKNLTPISFRQVEAIRVSTSIEKEGDDTLLSITPFLRSNSMNMLNNWSLGYDPYRNLSGHQSIGVLTRYRIDYETWKTRLIVGVDADYSPGFYQEWKEAVTKDLATGIYTSYTEGVKQYDFSAKYTLVSPYLHTEFSPVDSLRFELGMRYDTMSYAYTDHLNGVAVDVKHLLPANTTVSFNHASPKAGVTWQLGESMSWFMNYRHGFRAPDAGTLFRQGSAVSTVDLKPIKADSVETGLRHQAADWLYWEASLYRMDLTDDIVSYKDALNNTIPMNAGKTRHSGVEAGMEVGLSEDWSLGISWTNASHIYQAYRVSPTIDYSGKSIPLAPKYSSNTRLAWKPGVLNGGKIELEMAALGPYFLNDTNLNTYPGHRLMNLRANWKVSKTWNVYLRGHNLSDERYAMLAGYDNALATETFAPGFPRNVTVGVSVEL
ncbi:MAG: TonB-dependent receptor [Deltaproteobacteria bacterium]|nr:TonB-dependent receptor [Deltaproteobacteria bacterium]